MNGTLKRNLMDSTLNIKTSILNEMTNFMNKMRVKGHKNLLPFQKGVLLVNTSLQQLLPYLQETYTTDNFYVTYVMTNRLTQDCLKNLFSYLRAMGAANDQPSALNLRYRLRWYILGKHAFDGLSNAVNTEVDGNKSNLIDFNDSEDPLIGAAFNSGEERYPNPVADEEFNGFANEFQDEEFINNNMNEFESDMNIPKDEECIIQETIEAEGLKYIAGYVARRFRIKYPFLGDETRKLEIANDDPD
ncbi:unnamed protein product [Lasius platythorax]|uniref:Transposable element P transposase-like C-terminal domain-containing protein n=2 Tax=Lasius platythorax TaxID=488582 RepID=A0AAV2NTK1_9HYME